MPALCEVRFQAHGKQQQTTHIKSLPLWNVLDAAPCGRDEQKLRAVRPRATGGIIPLYRWGDRGPDVPRSPGSLRPSILTTGPTTHTREAASQASSHEGLGSAATQASAILDLEKYKNGVWLSGHKPGAGVTFAGSKPLALALSELAQIFPKPCRCEMDGITSISQARTSRL